MARVMRAKDNGSVGAKFRGIEIDRESSIKAADYDSVARLVFAELRAEGGIDSIEFAASNGLTLRIVQRVLEDFQNRGWIQRED